MRPWASWTAKTALLAVGFAAAGGSLSGAALAGTGDSAGLGHGSVLGTSVLADPARLPGDVCGSAAAVLGDSTAGCLGGALAGVAGGRPSQSDPGQGGFDQGGFGQTSLGPGNSAGDGIAARVIRGAVAPLTSALHADGPLPGLQPGLAPLPAVPVPTRTSAAAAGRTPDDPPAAASGAGDTNVPAAPALAGLGALSGLADLPSLAGLATMPALNGVTGGGIPMPGTALSAANTSGMSSDSFAALAVGALLAGASALKIAGRRSRDRKAGIGVAL